MSLSNRNNEYNHCDKNKRTKHYAESEIPEENRANIQKHSQEYFVTLCRNEKVQVGNDQEKAQSEKDSHSKNRGGKNQTNNQVLIP